MIDNKQIVSFEVKNDTAKKLDVIIDFLQGFPLLAKGIKGIRSIVLRLCVDDIYELFFSKLHYDGILNPDFKKKSEFYRIIKDKKMEHAFKRLDDKQMTNEERGEAINKIYEKIN